MKKKKRHTKPRARRAAAASRVPAAAETRYALSVKYLTYLYHQKRLGAHSFLVLQHPRASIYLSHTSLPNPRHPS